MSETGDKQHPLAERVKELERQIADLETRLPAHSIPPAMLIELEEGDKQHPLEEAWERAREDQPRG